jgi:Fibronectin type III domain
MKTKPIKKGILLGLSFCFLCLSVSVFSQVPSSIPGNSFGIGITGGTFPFASFGYYLFLPASAGNTYQVIGIYNVANSAGTYSYTPTSSTLAMVTFSDSISGTIRGGLSFAASGSGNFNITADAAPGAYQDGDFEMFSGAVPTSLAGKQVRCLIADGTSPFAFTGSFTLVAAASGNTYSVVGDGVQVVNSSGTYSYSLINATTGKMQINDSITGSSMVYLALSDNTTGGYAVKSTTSSGFQIGHFQFVTPSAPTPSAATSVTSSSFTANWNDVIGATGYRLDVSASSTFGSYVSGYQNLDVGDVTSRSIKGLTMNTIYYYRLRAYNTSGTSGNSSIINVTTLPNPPSAPTANAATSATSSSFSANWSSVLGVTGYRLDLSASSTFANYLNGYHDLDLGNVTSRTVTGLSAGTTYYYRVRSYNIAGTSGNSATISVSTTLDAPPSVGYARQAGQLIITWPTNFPGFTLEFTTDLPARSWIQASPSILNGQFTITDAIAGRQKFYRLRK